MLASSGVFNPPATLEDITLVAYGEDKYNGHSTNLVFDMSTLTYLIGDAIEEDDVVVAAISSGGVNTAPSISTSGYTLAAAAHGNDTRDAHSRIYHKLQSSTADTTITVVIPSNATGARIVVYVIRNCSTQSNPVHDTAANAATNTSSINPASTETPEGGFWVGQAIGGINTTGQSWNNPEAIPNYSADTHQNTSWSCVCSTGYDFTDGTAIDPVAMTASYSDSACASAFAGVSFFRNPVDTNVVIEQPTIIGSREFAYTAGETSTTINYDDVFWEDGFRGLQENDIVLLVGFHGCYSSSDAPPTVTAGSYTVLDLDTAAVDTYRNSGTLQYYQVGSTPETSVSLTMINAQYSVNMVQLYVIRGVDSASPVNDWGVATVGNSIYANPPSVTTANGGLAMYFGVTINNDSSSNSYTNPGDWSNFVAYPEKSRNLHHSTAWGYEDTTGAAVDPSALTYTGSNNSICSALGYSISFNPA